MDETLKNAVRVGLECSWSVRVKAWSATVQVLATHCVFKRGSNIVASPGTMLAPALLTDTEQQQQHILTPASAKAAPAQRHVRHCSICGAAWHTHAHTHERTHIQTQTRTNTRRHAHAGTHCTCARTNTNTHAPYTHARTHRHSHAHTNTHAHAHTHAHMHMHAHAACVMGFAIFSASLATLPHLS